MNGVFGFAPQRYGNDGWFKVGQVDVTTTILAVGISILSILLTTVSKGTFYEPFVLIGDDVRRGELWRLVTWPFINEPSIWAALSIAILFMLGGQLEMLLGKKRFAWMLALLVIVPSIVGTIYPVGRIIMSTNGGWLYPPSGAQFITSSLFVIFALRFPQARSFFNIPFWVVIAVFEAIFALQVISGRDYALLVFLLVTLGMGALIARAFDLTEFEQIPKIPLPQFITGDPYAKANRARQKAQRKQQPRKSSGHMPHNPFTRNDPADVISIRPEPRAEARLSRAEQAEMDRLLDKISESGMDSLSTAERAQLDALSRQLRGE